MIVSLIMIACSVTLAIFTILYMLTHRENYGTKSIVLLVSLIFLFYGVLYLPCLTLSVELIYAEDVALSMWKNSIILKHMKTGNGIFPSIITLDTIVLINIQKEKIKIKQL